MTAEDEEAVALEMAALEREAEATLGGTAPKVGVQVRWIQRAVLFVPLTLISRFPPLSSAA